MRIWLPFSSGGCVAFLLFDQNRQKKKKSNKPCYVCSTLKREKIPNLKSWYSDSSNGRKSSWCHESHLKQQKRILNSHTRHQQKNAMKQVSLGKYQFLYYRFKLALCFISTSLVPKSLILKSSLSNTLALNLARTQLDWLMSVSTHYSIPGQLIAISP